MAWNMARVHYYFNDTTAYVSSSMSRIYRSSIVVSSVDIKIKNIVCIIIYNIIILFQ